MKLLSILSLSLIIVSTTAIAQPLEGFADLVEKTRSSVVHIQSTTQQVNRRQNSPYDFFFQPQTPRGQDTNSAGSGFLISSDGYVVTNRHVVERADEISVILHDEKRYLAKLIGIDDSMDIALLKIDAGNLPFLRLGNSDKMRVGDTVLALGYPLYLGFSVTSGIISGIGRNMNAGQVDLATYIQTDADITFGNSGGPLVNNRGEVVGINTMIVSRGETYGFAIPSALFKHSIDQVKRHGEVRRGALGVTLASLDDEAREYYGIQGGALIQNVANGFPAAKAGIRKDDVIIAVDGQKVRNSQDVIALIGNRPPGSVVDLELLSDGSKTRKTIKLTDRRRLTDPDSNFFSDATDEPAREETGFESIGLSLLPLSEARLEEMGLEEPIGGVLSEGVAPGSLAESKQLTPGTVITHLNRQPITSVDQFEKVLGDVRSGGLVPVRVVQVLRTNYRVSRTERTVFLRKK